MNIWGKNDELPALVSYEKRQVANFERRQRKRRESVDMRMILDRAKRIGAGKVIIMDDGIMTELKFLESRDSNGRELDVMSKRLITSNEIIDITFKANVPMLPYSKEHDEDDIDKRMLTTQEIETIQSEDLAMQRDVRVVIAKAKNVDPVKEKVRQDYYNKVRQEYEAEKAAELQKQNQTQQ